MFQSIKNYIKTIFEFNETFRDNWVRKQANMIVAGSLVLDVGAGTCPYKLNFRHCTYRSHDFAKLDDGQLRQHKHYAKHDYASDICSIPVGGETFDVIICTEVLEHVPEPIKALQELCRILKSGGKIIITAPLGSGLHQKPYHFYGGYTPFWYHKYMSENGFVNLNISPNHGFFFYYAQESFRFVLFLAPWKKRINLLWVPLWVVSLIWCLIIRFLAKYLDSLDIKKDFTVGYFVTAIKS